MQLRSRWQRRLVLGATLGFYAGLAALVALVALTVALGEREPLIVALMGTGWGVGALGVGLAVFYAWHVMQNEVLTESGRGLWLLLVLKLGLVGMPLYGARYLWGSPGVAELATGGDLRGAAAAPLEVAAPVVQRSLGA